jgi:hypothetical protein
MPEHGGGAPPGTIGRHEAIIGAGSRSGCHDCWRSGETPNHLDATDQGAIEDRQVAGGDPVLAVLALADLLSTG